MKTITIKDLLDEDFINYKKAAMFIATSKCSFKCEKEDNNVHCQNSKIAKQTNLVMIIDKIIDRYMNNIITESIVFGGLEPLDQIDELLDFIYIFRQKSSDDIVIYTGYTEDEVKSFKHHNKSYLEALLEVNRTAPEASLIKPSLIIKYGRFKANGDKKYDDILGIELASSNQYAKIYN